MSELSHADFYPDEAFPEDPEDIQNPNLPSYWRNHYALVKKLHTARVELLGCDRYLTAEEERELATLIQAGVLAAADAKETGELYDGRYDAIIQAGNDARYRLVVASLPFAAFFARASVGKVPDGNTDIPIPALPGDAKSYVGTYANVRKLASPRADIDDRTQVAMEAMWKAAGNFEAKSAKFITFAAWHMQRALDFAEATENSGWQLPKYALQQYIDALKHQELEGTLPDIQHRSASGYNRKGAHPLTVFEGRKGIPFEQAGHWNAPEEESTIDGEAEALAIVDVVPDNDGNIYEPDVERALIRASLERQLWKLDLKEEMVIRFRYGLDDDTPKTQLEIAELMGVTQARISQIERKALFELRRAQALSGIKFTDYIRDEFYISSALDPMISGTASIKTQSVIARSIYSVAETDEEECVISEVAPEPKEPWQAYPEEEWDEDIRQNRF